MSAWKASTNALPATPTLKRTRGGGKARRGSAPAVKHSSDELFSIYALEGQGCSALWVERDRVFQRAQRRRSIKHRTVPAKRFARSNYFLRLFGLAQTIQNGNI
jgi:hypothetical protein